MNQRTRRLVMDLLVSLALSLVLAYLSWWSFQAGWLSGMAFPLLLGLGPILWVSFRHGPAAGIVAGGLVALIQPLLLPLAGSYWVEFAQEGIPLLAGGLGGLFAKNTQRTLNNYRYSSTYLNLVTGTFLGVLLAGFLRYGIGRFVLDQSLDLGGGFWLVLGLSFLLISLALVLPAKHFPAYLIPRRSRFLPRRETTSLLND